VSYLGSFTGTYGITGNLTRVQDSGNRTYTIDGTGSSIVASFQKDDTSTRSHALSVEIWVGGKAVKVGQTSEPHGNVSISYP